MVSIRHNCCLAFAGCRRRSSARRRRVRCVHVYSRWLMRHFIPGLLSLSVWAIAACSGATGNNGGGGDLSIPAGGDDLTMAADLTPALCGDGMKDGDETDVDCGGSCAACDIGKACSNGTDCKSAVCTMNKCD